MVKIINKKWGFGFLLLLSIGVMFLSLPLLSAASHAADIELRADRTPVAVNESFQLFFETSGDVDGDPDFSPLKQNFDILGKKQSSNYQFINGNRSQSISWVLTLMPKKAGEVVIPAISFGSSTSRPTSIAVTKEKPITLSAKDKNPNIFLNVETDISNPYIQAQVVLTVRFFRAITITSANMTPPTFEGGEVVIETLGKGRQYKTQKNNRTFIVDEKRYAVFPQESGKLTLKPIQLTAKIGGGNQIFGTIFNDPFARQRSSIRRVSSQPITLQVQPIPDSFKGKRWLPAHELILTEKWSKSPTKFIVGEPITRSTIMMADGIPAKQLPEIPIQETKGLKQYTDRAEVSDQVELSGIVGILRQKNAIIPTTSSQYELAAIEIPWWDVDEDILKIARLPAITFAATPVPGAKQTTNPSPLPAPQPLPAPAPNLTERPETISPSPTQPPPYQLPWLSMLLGAGWLITALAWWWKQRRHKSNTYQEKAVKNVTKTLKQLKKHAIGNSAPETRRLLIQWGGEQWPEIINLGIDDISSRVSPAMQEELKQLNRALFAKENSTWQGETLWQEIEKHHKNGKKQPKNQGSENLVPLYEVKL